MSEQAKVNANALESKSDHRSHEVRRSDAAPSVHLGSPYEQVIFLQRTVGNQAVERLLRSRAIQAKLTVNPPDDKYEREADRVADQVLRMPPTGPSNDVAAVKPAPAVHIQQLPKGDPALLYRELEADEEKDQEILQTKQITGPPQDPSPDLSSRVGHLKGRGRFLPKSVRDFFEPRFGHDFSQVRVHTDPEASGLARNLNARAFTVGHDIVFGAGQYAAGGTFGKRLLAHELVHTIQQDGDHSANHRQIRTPIIQKTPGRSIQRDEGNVGRETIPAGGTEVNKIGIVYTADGANLRDAPDPARRPTGWIAFNTKVSVIKSFPGGWYFIALLGTGDLAYVAANRIWTHLPEPNARLHKIQPNETAQEIARRYYGADAIGGRDERYYVNVLVHMNKGEGDPSKGIYKEKRGGSWKETKTRAKYLIWIPSRSFAKTLIGTVKSGSISHGIYEALAGILVGFRDLKDGISLSTRYLGEAIKKRVSEALKEVLISLAILLVGAVAILAVTTIVGTAIAALVSGGAAAGAGAAIGFKVGLAILKWLGLALLLYWVGSKVLEIGGAFWRFLKKAWGADGNYKVLDQSAREFADAVALLLAFILQAVIFYAIKVGSTRALGKLGDSRFGKWIGKTRLGQWIADRLVGAERTVPESAKGKEFGLFEEGYLPEGIFRRWAYGPDKFPAEGWKIHVSANPASAPRIAEIALPLLRSLRADHKVVNYPEMLATEMTGTQTGKFITVWCENAAQAQSVAKALNGALAGQGLKGPTIAGEKSVGASGLVYVRYGGLRKSTVRDQSGKEVEDVRGKYKPDWIKEDPFPGGRRPRGPAPVPGTEGSDEKQRIHVQRYL